MEEVYGTLAVGAVSALMILARAGTSMMSLIIDRDNDGTITGSA